MPVTQNPSPPPRTTMNIFHMPIPQRKTVIAIALLILLVEFVVVYVVTRPKTLGRAALTLRSGTTTATTHETTSPEKLLITPDISLVDLTLFIPHSPLTQTRYILSMIGPGNRHITMPSLFTSRPGRAEYDTLRLSLDKNYFNGPEGNYTLILNEIFLENAGSLSAGVYLYPVAVASK